MAKNWTEWKERKRRIEANLLNDYLETFKIMDLLIILDNLNNGDWDNYKSGNFGENFYNLLKFQNKKKFIALIINVINNKIYN